MSNQNIWQTDVLVVDGNSVAHRAFHAKISRFFDNSETIRANQQTRKEGMLGILRYLTNLVEGLNPSSVVVAFDAPGENFRRDIYPPYKAHRPDKSEALTDLLDYAPEVLQQLGISTECHAPFEADDICGSVAKQANDNSKTCVIATSDRDAYSLIDTHTRVLNLGNEGRHTLVDNAYLYKKYQIESHQYTEFAALRGDSSDNLPGIKGIGEKRAARLLNAFESLENAVSDISGCKQILGPKLSAAFIEDWHSNNSLTKRNIDLMTIRRDVPVAIGTYRRKHDVSKVKEAINEHGLTSMEAPICMAFAEVPQMDMPSFDELDLFYSQIAY